MDGDDAVLDFAHAAQILPLDARRSLALLHTTGLVDHPNGAEAIVRHRVHHFRQMALQVVPRCLVVPLRRHEKLLQCSHRRATRQGDRFHALARQVRQQASTVVVEMLGRPPLEKSALVAPEKLGKRRPQVRDFLIGHRIPSR